MPEPTIQEILDLATINPELEEILKKEPLAPGLDSSTNISKVRGYLLTTKKQWVLAQGNPDAERVHEVDRLIEMRDGVSINVRIHSPLATAGAGGAGEGGGGSPVLVMYHGGGYCIGGLDNETLLCRKWVTEYGGVAVNVDYRLAPEHPFPTGINDAYDALKWTASHLSELNGNAAKGFLVGGISAGANFAAVVSHLWRDDKLSPPLTGLYLSIPPTLVYTHVPEKYKELFLSRDQNAHAPVLDGKATEAFGGWYQGDPASPLCSPFLFPSHKDLPPSYFQICGLDPLRDEAILYEQVMRLEYGVKTKVDMYPGLPHSFWSHWPNASFSVKHKQDSIDGLGWLLEQKS